jgi:hypothetical protein
MVILVRTLHDNGKIQISYPTVEGKKVDTAKAKSLDLKIKKKICSIEDNARKITVTVKIGTTGKTKTMSLLDLKGGKKHELVYLYHYVGTELKPFIDGLKLNRDDKHHIWDVLNFHSDKLKMMGRSRIDRDKGHRNAWKNCIKLAGYSKKDAFELDWGNWVELFDTYLSQNDPRIIDWIISTKRKRYDNAAKDGGFQDWFRILRSSVTNQISKGNVGRKKLLRIDTTYLNVRELHAELEEALGAAGTYFEALRDEVVERRKIALKKVSERKVATKKKQGK